MRAICFGVADKSPSTASISDSALRLLDEGGNPGLFGGCQFLQGEGGRPHRAFIQSGLVAETQRRIPRLELLRALEEAQHAALSCVGRHPVPGSRLEVWRAGFDDRVEP